MKASLIAGTALSTTSLAVVYAVLVETGLNATKIGKLIMSACFVTDMGTALALSAIFIKPNAWFPLFLIVSVGLIVVLPKIAPWFFGRYGDRVIEPEIKLVFACLFVLMVLADAAKGHAVLPVFVAVEGLLLWNVIRYRKRDDSPVPQTVGRPITLVGFFLMVERTFTPAEPVVAINLQLKSE